MTITSADPVLYQWAADALRDVVARLRSARDVAESNVPSDDPGISRYAYISGYMTGICLAEAQAIESVLLALGARK